MKNVKRFATLLVAIVMLFGVTTSASAMEVTPKWQSTETEEVQPRIGYAVHNTINCPYGSAEYHFTPKSILFPYNEWSVKTTNCANDTVVEVAIYQEEGDFKCLAKTISITGNYYVRNIKLMNNFEAGKKCYIDIKAFKLSNRNQPASATVEFWIF